MLEFHSQNSLKKKRVKLRAGHDIEPHEIFLDRLAQKKESELGISQKKLEVPLPRIILRAFLFIMLAVFAVFYIKIFVFQILENKKYVAMAQQNKFIIHSIQAIRGVVYDSKGEQLVFNKLSFDLICEKNKLPEEKQEMAQAISQVSGILQISPADLQKKITEATGNSILIAQNLDYQTLVLFETKKVALKGFGIEKNTVRDYRDAATFAALVGYTGRVGTEEIKENSENYSVADYIGREGLEKTYEEYLRKKPGKLQIERDAKGNQLSQEITSLPESGQSLVLWLDASLQKKTEAVLGETMKRIGAKSAVAIALDPRTGGVLTMVSLPSYDNNLFNKGADPGALKELLADKSQPLFNRAIAGQFPTGSVIKPLEATAALEEKLISPAKTLDCKGEINIPNRYNPEVVYTYRDWTTHGITDMRQAIAESCNVYFYTIGGGFENQKGLEPSNLKKYLELFGWGNKTQIDLPGESSGFIPDPEWKKKTRNENWWDGDSYNLSIGQGDIGITPLQVAASFVAVANGGTLYQPQVVKKIIDENKNTVKDFSPKILRQNFVDPENLQVAREGMRWAVTGENSPKASSTILNSLPVTAAAKTGTAQIPKFNHYDNWVTVFAPYDNPQIVLTILLEDVENTQVAALPVAKEVLSWYFNQETNKNLTNQ